MLMMTKTVAFTKILDLVPRRTGASVSTQSTRRCSLKHSSAEQSNKLPYFPSPPTPPDVPSATPPGAAILASWLRSWRFLDRSHLASEHTPSAAHCPDQLPPRCVE